jgi:hypothetical protein
MILRTSIAIVLTATIVVGQQVSVTFRAGSLLQSSATLGPQSTFAVQPVGGLPDAAWFQNALLATGPGDYASSELFCVQNRLPGDVIDIQVGQTLAVQSQVGASASTIQSDLQVILQAPAPRAVVLSMLPTLLLTAGATAPSMQLDLGNDGTFDIDLTTPNFTLPLVIGPLGYVINCRMQADIASVGGNEVVAHASMRFELRANNDLQVSPLIGGCGSGSIDVGDSLANYGVHVGGWSVDLPLAVLGLGTQPTLLPPSPLSPVPCLLLPSPDLVLLLPPTGFDLPIPPSVRPINLYVQGVGLELNTAQLSTLQGYLVQAL